MRDLVIEFTDDTLIMTERGIERLSALLRRPVNPVLWAIKWKYKDIPNGISFHRAHKDAKKFAAMQIDSVPDGPARLVDVSPWLVEAVKEHDYCWTNLNSFEEALTYKGPTCSH